MWFTETPWPPIVLCSVLAVLLVAAWYENRRGIYLLGTLGLIGLSGLIYAAERKIVTDAERIENSLVSMAAAYERDNLEETLSYFSPKATILRAVVTHAIGTYNVQDDLRITDVQIAMKSENSRALSHFRANATVITPQYGNVGYRQSRWELTWQREAGEWKIISLQRLNPYKNEVMDTLAHSEQ